MSASMLRQMLEDAGAFLKTEKYQEALDASRRVTQFDPNNFQAFMCVGMANFNLQQVAPTSICLSIRKPLSVWNILTRLTVKSWEDCEEAYRRAAGLKPELPAAWKVWTPHDRFAVALVVCPFSEYVVDVGCTSVCYTVVAIEPRGFIRGAERTSKETRAIGKTSGDFPKAFDAWYSLVAAEGEETREICLAVTPNDELPATMVIWLDLVDLLQRPNFSLSDCSTERSIAEISTQLFAAGSLWDWKSAAQENAELFPKMDASIAFFMRFSLDELKTVKPASRKEKSELLRKLDTQALSIVSWFPTAKIPAEFLLLRSEDDDSPIDLGKATEIAADLDSVHPKSPMSQIFRGLRFLESNEIAQGRENILEALAYCSSSSFHESSYCVRAQVELASLALSTRDVEGCLSRLQKAKYLLKEKAQLFGCSGPNPLIYSETKSQLMEATAREYSGDFEKALEAYHTLLGSEDSSIGFQATVRASELLLTKSMYQETLDALDTFSKVEAEKTEGDHATISSIRGWVLFKLGSVEEGKDLLERAAPSIPTSSQAEKARGFKRLAIVYWHLDGTYRQEKSFCFGHLLQAAKLMPSDSEIFGWLGKYYQEVANDVLRAEKCFLKALSLSSGNEMAGVALSDLYEQQQKRELNVKLWEDMTQEQETAPTWALLRLAQHLIDNDEEQAVGKLHLVLRNDPFNAQYWVTLGHVYRHFGKLVSAQKSYLKAIELGETSWCVMCEMARIEGALLLFDEAFGHIEPLVSASSLGTEHIPIVSLLYAELLFKQAKHLCAEGLYGRAAGNLKKASRVMKSLSSSGLSSSVEGFKLIGDIHCFAFYLSPNDFDSAEGDAPISWVAFISDGRKAYEAVASLLATSGEVASGKRAEVYYDIGLSNWYEAQALCTVHGIHFSGFEHLYAPRALKLAAEIEKQTGTLVTIKHLKEKARKSFSDAVKISPDFGLAWNGLAIVHDHLLVKQFSWTRAIQAESSESAWANLGMLYVHQPVGKTTASLAQKAFIHLQGVNSDNPSMWNGYGMLSRREVSEVEKQKAIEAFRCALEAGLDLDALQGFTTAILSGTIIVGEESASEKSNSNEELLFAMRKVLERDPYNPGAWNALGVLQQRLGLYEESRVSLENALSCVSKASWYAQRDQQKGVEWNANLARFGGADKLHLGDSTAGGAFDQAIAAVQGFSSDGSKTRVLISVLKAQKRYHVSDGKGALQELSGLLQQDLSTSERDVVAVVALSIAGLLSSAHPAEAQVVSKLSKEHLLRNLAAKISKSKLHVVEMHERFSGSASECLSILEIAAGASDQPLASAWSRLAFAMIDFQAINNTQLLSASRQSAKKLRFDSDEVEDASYARTLVGLLQDLSEGYSAYDAQKVVHMQPWNPNAYLVAGAALLKSKSVDAASVVIESGLKVAQSSPAHEYERTQLHWMLCFCYAQLGESSKVAEHSSAAHDWIATQKAKSASPSRLLEFELLDARLLSISSPVESIERYHAALKLVSTSSSSTHRFVSILTELGGVYEEANSLDCALQVWKFIAGLMPSTSLSSPPNAGSFLSNLRLALVHGKKQNTKSAKKQIKTAISLAPSPESMQATVASFVESVIAKSA